MTNRTTAPPPPRAPATSVSRTVRKDSRFQAAVQSQEPDPDWRSRGACLGRDPEVFFPNAADDHSPALAVCQFCPVRGACLAAALDTGELDGVWGGTTPSERRSMRQVWRTAIGAAGTRC